ncbi:MAG: hypothetical protein L0H84_24385, partial [Pseudonocardia sp.]|nr:hypothetical protein [Pseudonocardia sp.]
MSAPVTERPRTGTRTSTIPDQRRRPRRAQRTVQEARTQNEVGSRIKVPARARNAADRAYQRRAVRLSRLSSLGGLWTGTRQAMGASTPGRTPFVLMVMGLLAVGLAAILWLSTAAAADAYRLTDARAAARALQEQSGTLRIEVSVLQSAPELARRATALGLVPAHDPARLV